MSLENNSYLKKVLVIEDDALAKMAIKAILDNIGCYVQVANNGYEALAILQDKTFDIILTDIHMPKMTGYELTKFIRDSESRFKNIPIFGITAQIGPDDIQKAKDAGINKILTKPININVLKNLMLNLNNKHFNS